MSVTSCTLNGRLCGDAEFDQRNLGTYQLYWNITTNSHMSGKAVANGALSGSPHPLPTLWSTYSYLGEDDDYAYLRKLTIKKRSKRSLYHWLATGTYTPLAPGEVHATSNGFNASNPIDRPPVWEGDGEVYTKLIEVDQAGDAIVNPAGKPYNPTLEREEARCIVVATKNYATLTAALDVMQAMTNAVNSAAWQGRAIRNVWCQEARPHAHQTEGDKTYYPVSFRFALKEDDGVWDDKILQQGFGYLTTANDESTYTEVDGPEPVLLDNDGTKLAAGVAGKFATHRTLREVNFTTELGF